MSRDIHSKSGMHHFYLFKSFFNRVNMQNNGAEHIHISSRSMMIEAVITWLEQ